VRNNPDGKPSAYVPNGSVKNGETKWSVSEKNVKNVVNKKINNVVKPANANVLNALNENKNDENNSNANELNARKECRKKRLAEMKIVNDNDRNFNDNVKNKSKEIDN